MDALFTQISGKELSYNNLLDVDAAVNLMGEFTETTFAILKHNNACGIASRPVVLDAWKAALAGDPTSAFGGVLICNTTIDLATAEEINKLRKNLDQQLTSFQDLITKLANKLQRQLLAKQSRAWQFDLEEGLLDSSKLTRIIMDPYNSLSFKKKKI